MNSLSAKFSYLGVEQSEEIEKQEYLQTSDELMQLYMRNAVLAEISNLAYLRKRKEEEPQKVIEQPQEEINVEQEQSVIQPPGAIPPVADDENPFESVFLIRVIYLPQSTM